jgi:hypothetical protein
MSRSGEYQEQDRITSSESLLSLLLRVTERMLNEKSRKEELSSR